MFHCLRMSNSSNPNNSNLSLTDWKMLRDWSLIMVHNFYLQKNLWTEGLTSKFVFYAITQLIYHGNWIMNYLQETGTT